jgi:hypothetical protein
VEDDVREPDAAMRLELHVLRVVQAKYFTTTAYDNVPIRHIGIARSVPERSPTTIIRQPTPTKEPTKNGPEIIDFRPVL